MDAIKTALATALTLSLSMPALATTEADVEQSFYPYKSGVPSFSGLQAGVTIDQGNADQFKEVLDPAMHEFIKQGWTAIKVGETTSFDY